MHHLSAPFPLRYMSWKPGATTRDKSKALALAYGDLRAYQKRLDEIFGSEWEVTYTPWEAGRIIAHLTIRGVTRSGTGETSAESERSEIGGTVAEAQAFKRACAMFGLGRYLYDMGQAWVEFDSGSKRFSDRAVTELKTRYATWLERWHSANPEVAQDNDQDTGPDHDTGEDREPPPEPRQQAAAEPKTRPATQHKPVGLPYPDKNEKIPSVVQALIDSGLWEEALTQAQQMPGFEATDKQAAYCHGTIKKHAGQAANLVEAHFGIGPDTKPRLNFCQVIFTYLTGGPKNKPTQVDENLRQLVIKLAAESAVDDLWESPAGGEDA